MTELADIPGIELIYIIRLEIIQIYTTRDLLERASNKEDRQLIADEIWAGEEDVFSWVKQADLYRINGLEKPYLKMLNVCGIKCVDDLSISEPDLLSSKIKAVLHTDQSRQSMLMEDQLQGWINQSRLLPQAVFS